MKFVLPISALWWASWNALTSHAFVPVALVVSPPTQSSIFSNHRCPHPRGVPLCSTVETETRVEVSDDAAESLVWKQEVHVNGKSSSLKQSQSLGTTILQGSEIKEKLQRRLAQLREKDSKSPKLNKEDIKVIYEDEHIIVVEKPSGVLCVPGKDGFPNLADAVWEANGCPLGRADRMVVHRLGMDTSGLVVFAKTIEAVRGMNTLFRTRQIERHYEAVVCGHVEKNEGLIDLPLMRDYEFPPYMRISTDDHQRALVDLSPSEVGKKLLAAPKNSLTRYQVLAREEYEGLPVTRLSLSSLTGRTHQLNVHLAALGHPIVGDRTYGMDGAAAPNGGLTEAEFKALVDNPSRADAALQQQLAEASQGKPACIHAKSLRFRHPVTKEDIYLSADAPF